MTLYIDCGESVDSFIGVASIQTFKVGRVESATPIKLSTDSPQSIYKVIPRHALLELLEFH